MRTSRPVPVHDRARPTARRLLDARCMYARALTLSLAAVLFAAVPTRPAAAQGAARDSAESDASRLRTELHRAYPSLAHVGR